MPRKIRASIFLPFHFPSIADEKVTDDDDDEKDVEDSISYNARTDRFCVCVSQRERDFWVRFLAS